jgi:hypothetical protein
MTKPTESLTITETLARVPEKLGYIPRESLVVLILTRTSAVRAVLVANLDEVTNPLARPLIVARMTQHFPAVNAHGLVLAVYTDTEHSEHATAINATRALLGEHVPAATHLVYVTGETVTDEHGNTHPLALDPITATRPTAQPDPDDVETARAAYHARVAAIDEAVAKAQAVVDAEIERVRTRDIADQAVQHENDEPHSDEAANEAEAAVIAANAALATAESAKFAAAEIRDRFDGLSPVAHGVGILIDLIAAATRGAYTDVTTPGKIGAATAAMMHPRARDAAVMALVDPSDNYRLARRLATDPNAPGVRVALERIIGTESGIQPDTQELRDIAAPLWDMHAFAPDADAKVAPLTLLALLAMWHNDTAAARTLAREAINASDDDKRTRLACLILQGVNAGMTPGWVNQ